MADPKKPDAEGDEIKEEIVESAESEDSEDPTPESTEETNPEPDDSPQDEDAAASEETTESESFVSNENAEETVAPPIEQLTEVTVKRTGFVPVVSGGIVAAALGFAAAYFGLVQPQSDALETTISEQNMQIEALKEQVSTLSTQISALPDADTVKSEIAAALPDNSQAQSDLSALKDQVSGLAARVETIPPGGVSLSELSSSEMADFQTKLAEATAQAEADLKSIQEQSAQIEAEATAARKKAETTAALAQITSAVESGGGFADALSVVSENGLSIPDALTQSASDGVASLQTLISSFPDDARAALDASIRADSGTSTGDRLMSFLRVQTGARSLTPREGDDADAILSRAEDDLKKDDLSQALEELAALPEAGKEAMANWVATAQQRQSVTAALDQLRSEIEQN